MTKDELYKMLSEVPSKENETEDADIPVDRKDNGDGTVTLSTIMSVGKDGESESDNKGKGKPDEEEADAVANDEGMPNAEAVAEGEAGVDIDEAKLEALKGIDCETLANRRLATQVILSLYSSTETKASILDLLKSFWQRKDIGAMVGLGKVIADIKKNGSLGEDGFSRVKEALKKVRTSLEGEEADAIYKRCSEEVREKMGGLLTESLS